MAADKMKEEKARMQKDTADCRRLQTAADDCRRLQTQFSFFTCRE